MTRLPRTLWLLSWTLGALGCPASSSDTGNDTGGADTAGTLATTTNDDGSGTPDDGGSQSGDAGSSGGPGSTGADGTMTSPDSDGQTDGEGSSGGPGETTGGGVGLPCQGAVTDTCLDCMQENCCDLLGFCTTAECQCMAECVGEAGFPGTDACVADCRLDAIPRSFEPLLQCADLTCPDSDECSSGV